MRTKTPWFVALLAVVFVGCGLALLPGPAMLTLEAQTVPYTLTMSYPASPDAVTYNCYLDGAIVASNVATLACTFPVPALGAHVAGVTAVNPAFVPTESDPATIAFTLKQPAKPGAPKVK